MGGMFHEGWAGRQHAPNALHDYKRSAMPAHMPVRPAAKWPGFWYHCLVVGG
jgi:hypothetical protein